MKKHTITTYEFNELKPEVQEKTLNRYRNFNTDYYDWYNFLLDDWTERLESIGFSSAKIYFSGFSNQGDGAVFEASINHDKLLNSIIMCNDYDTAKQAEKCLFLQDSGLLYFNLQRNSYANRYDHEKTACITVERKISDSSYWNEIIKSITSVIEELRINLCRQIYKELENEYNYLTSDAAIKETFEANEHEFTVDGKIFINKK